MTFLRHDHPSRLRFSKVGSSRVSGHCAGRPHIERGRPGAPALRDDISDACKRSRTSKSITRTPSRSSSCWRPRKTAPSAADWPRSRHGTACCRPTWCSNRSNSCRTSEKRHGTSRRELLKAQAAAVATAAGIPFRRGQPVAGGIGALEIKWSKAPCRFCGTGCGVMVGVKEGKVVATHGDTLAEVNRGLNCIKGYFLSKIMYGADRLTTPLLRKKDGVYDKDGELTPVGWDEAFDVMAAQRQGAC